VPHVPPQGMRPTRRELRQATGGADDLERAITAGVVVKRPRRRDLHRGPHTGRAQTVSSQPPRRVRRKDLRASPRPRGRRRALTLVSAFGAVAFLAAPVSVSSPQAEVISVPVVVPAETSALGVLHGAAERFELESASAAAAILDRPAERAMASAVRASRTAERSQLAVDGSPSANGMAAALVPARQKVVMPLAEGSYRITSRYGTRQNPFGGAAQFHYGVDLAAPLDTPIHAVADGVVTYVGEGRAGRSSMLIIIEHEIEDQTVYTWYNHMYASGLYVEPGQAVEAGQVIAGVGSNGNSTGPHLHLEVHTDDQLTTVNPLNWLQEHEAVDVGEL